MEGPEGALRGLARELRANETVITPYVRDSDERPAVGLLVARGPRTERAPGDYALVVEAVREGYLLHYGEPRVVITADRDLALLAGDYLYALGIERLAGLGDLEAIRELSDLISLSAQLHASPDVAPARAADALWLAAAIAVAAGASPEHDAAKLALRNGRPAAAALWLAALETARREGLGEALGATAEAIGFESIQHPA
jgi:hypothetical protein